MNCANNMIYAENLLSSGSLDFWYMLSRKCFCDQSPIKSLGTESLMNFSGKYFSCIVTSTAGKIKCILCDSPGRGLLAPCTWFPLEFTSFTFSLCWFFNILLLWEIIAMSTTMCWVLWVLVVNCWIWGWPWGPHLSAFLALVSPSLWSHSHSPHSRRITHLAVLSHLIDTTFIDEYSVYISIKDKDHTIILCSSCIWLEMIIYKNTIIIF